MPVTTRSRRAQDANPVGASEAESHARADRRGVKRKANTNGSPEGARKKMALKNTFQVKSEGDEQNSKPRTHNEKEDPSDGPIVINRAPVLQLWGASVAQFLHPELTWELCLSVGSSISTIIAISKGRSIGTIAEADPSKEKKKKEDERVDEPSFRVMGFPMVIKGNGILVKGRVQTANEKGLAAKFGGENQYQAVRSAMRGYMERSWKGREQELDRKAFHMYEEFRPSVPAGQKGWGRKAELRLDRIREAVQQ